MPVFLTEVQQLVVRMAERTHSKGYARRNSVNVARPPSTDVGHDCEFEGNRVADLNGVLLHFIDGAGRAEVELLPDDFPSDRVLGAPVQRELLCALLRRLPKYHENSLQRRWHRKEQADRLLTGDCGAPLAFGRRRQRATDRMLRVL